MKIYVASSWRNEHQPAVVAALREAGHEVYDFKNPPQGTGFGWRKVTDEPVPWSAERTREVLTHPIAQAGFDSDFDAMNWSDAIVMVQPCGRSAALELGWGVGARKVTVVLLADAQEPELMLKCADHLALSLEEVLDYLGRWDPVSKTLRPAPCDAAPAVRYRRRSDGVEATLVRPAAIEGALTLRFEDGTVQTLFSGGDWVRL